MGQLKNRVAMITGAASGIGRATAILMASRGASVLVTDINMDSATGVVDEIRSSGGTASAAFCDIGDEGSIISAVAEAEKRFGKLDVLHNNAALLSAAAIAGDQEITDIPVDVWDDIMRVTVRGTMIATRHAIFAMRRAGRGSIINTSSIYGLKAANRLPAYSVSKAAVAMLTEVTATTYGRENIRCNAVAPSMIRTPTLNLHVADEIVAYNEDAALLPRLGTPEDIANVVAFLASDDASYVTGMVIPVDGGTLAHLPTYGDERRYLEKVRQSAK